MLCKQAGFAAIQDLGCQQLAFSVGCRKYLNECDSQGSILTILKYIYIV
jgi:hypothetical protein